MAHREDTRTVLMVSRTWEGAQIGHDEVVWVSLGLEEGFLNVDIRATRHGDPAPDAPPGRLDRLWEHEVVEVFIAGAQDHYLELEMGPHGHYLVLRFRGERDEIGRDYPIEYQVHGDRTGPQRWRGVARIPEALLPEAPLRINAYAIHGTGEQRRYLVAHPSAELLETPDFHRLSSFRPLFL